jgi:hypothetical protein
MPHASDTSSSQQRAAHAPVGSRQSKPQDPSTFFLSRTSTQRY